MTVPMRVGRGHRMPPVKEEAQKAPQSPQAEPGPPPLDLDPPEA